MKVILFECEGQLESKRLYAFETDVPPVVGDEVSVLGVGDFVVRKRTFDVMKIGLPGDEPTALTQLYLYVQPRAAFEHELAQVNHDEA